MKRILTLSLVLLCTSGCLRGESKSLEQVLQSAKDTYAATSKADLPPEVSQSIDQVVKQLDLLVSSGDAAAITQITDGLTTLLPRAGYTVRPALTELRNQYAELSQGAAPTSQEAKLLASRTLSTLSEELNAKRFGLEE